MVTELTERIAHMLCMAGWTSPNDAQWTYLERLLPDLREALMSVPNQPHKSGTNEADRLREAATRLLSHCDRNPLGETDFERAVIHLRNVIERMDHYEFQPHKPGPSAVEAEAMGFDRETYEDIMDSGERAMRQTPPSAGTNGEAP